MMQPEKTNKICVRIYALASKKVWIKKCKATLKKRYLKMNFFFIWPNWSCSSALEKYILFLSSFLNRIQAISSNVHCLPPCISTWHTFLMDGRTTVTFHPIFFGKPSKEQLALITCQEPFNAHWSKANRIKPSLGFCPRNYNIVNTYQSQAFDFFYENYKYLLCFQSFQR